MTLAADRRRRTRIRAVRSRKAVDGLLVRASRGRQVENRARFFADFSLPNGAEDKLLTAPAGTYPEDHVANMSGNIDDHFRIGIKVTRKTIKMFSDFYSSDIILASPLGLRELIEKEK